jgi:hypothetical protein
LADVRCIDRMAIERFAFGLTALTQVFLPTVVMVEE